MTCILVKKSNIEPPSGPKLFISRGCGFPSVAEALDIREKTKGERKSLCKLIFMIILFAICESKRVESVQKSCGYSGYRNAMLISVPDA